MTVYNGQSVFGKVLRQILEGNNSRLVLHFLVTFSFWLKNAADQLPNCAKDFRQYEATVLNMAMAFLSLDKFDDERYMVAVLLPHVELPTGDFWFQVRSFWVRRCFTDKKGVLAFAFEKDIKWLLGHPLISLLAQEMFMADAIPSIYQFCSSPFVVLVMKGLIHIAVLVAIAFVGIHEYGSRSASEIGESLAVSEYLLAVIMLSMLLHEVGEIIDSVNDAASEHDVFCILKSHAAGFQLHSGTMKSSTDRIVELYGAAVMRYFRNPWNWCDIITVLVC